MDQYKRQRYRSASIHSTADGVVHDNAPNTVAQPPLQIDLPSPETENRNADTRRLEDTVEHEDVHQIPQSSSDSHLLDEHPSADQTPDGHMNLTLNRCPTFLRRQAQSLLPRRSISAGKQSLALLKERGAMSTPMLPSSAPTRHRARLQRRARPKPSSPTT
jgi:hypothetical protein